MTKCYLAAAAFAALFCLNSSEAAAQVGIGTSNPDPSAQLEIVSTDKGLLIPRVASVSAVSTPAKGLIVYQTGAPEGFYYNSGNELFPSWKMIANTTTGATGTAGGVLTGTYPNPDIAIFGVQNLHIATNAITTSKVANGTITAPKMADSAITSIKLISNAVGNKHIIDGVLTPSKFSGAGATSGQVITYNGSNVVWGNVSAGASGYTLLSANTTLSTASAKYVINGDYIITLPASPVVGQEVAFISRYSAFELATNGKSIYDVFNAQVWAGTNFDYTTTGRTFKLIWDGTYWLIGY